MKYLLIMMLSGFLMLTACTQTNNSCGDESPCGCQSACGGTPSYPTGCHNAIGCTGSAGQSDDL